MCRLSKPRVWDYKSASTATENITVLVILVLAVLMAGMCIWSIKFIAHPTARTLLRVFVGLCLAAIVAYLVLASGFPTALLVSAGIL
jgi:bacteriorhodopsin